MSDSNEKQRWVAYELHDRLLPWLHGAKMQLSNLKVSAESEAQLRVAKHCLTIAGEEGRALIGFLESYDQQQAGSLESSILKFVAVTEPMAAQQQQQIEIEEPLASTLRLSITQAWNLLRILQQSVLNAVQHAGPCIIRISMLDEGHAFKLSVRDSGVGFDASSAIPSNHFGLVGMRERARSIGAQLDIRSSPGKGTSVSLILPH